MKGHASHDAAEMSVYRNVNAISIADDTTELQVLKSRTSYGSLNPDGPTTANALPNAVVRLNEQGEPQTSVGSSPSPEGQESESSTGSKNLKSVLRPIFISLRLFGLLWKKDHQAAFDCNTIYAIFVCSLSWLTSFQLFAMYKPRDSYGKDLMKKFASHAWHFQMAIIITSFVYNFYKLFPKFYRRWEWYKRKYGGVPLHLMITFTYRITTAMDVTFGLVFLAFLLGVTIKPPKILLFVMEPFQSPPRYVVCVYFAINLFIAFAWLQPFIFLSILALLLRKEFLELTKAFKSALSVTPDLARGKSQGQGHRLDLEGFRLRHLTLCKICDKLDDMMSPFILSTYILDVPMLGAMIMFMLTNEARTPDNFMSVAAAACAFLVALVHLVGVTVVGATLTAAVSI